MIFYYLPPKKIIFIFSVNHLHLRKKSTICNLQKLQRDEANKNIKKHFNLCGCVYCPKLTILNQSNNNIKNKVFT